MSANAYRFVTKWRVRSTCEEVTEILSNTADLPRWWPSVYKKVEMQPNGDARLHSKAKLPYTLDWSFRVIERRTPHGFTIEAWGDFVGTGTWTFTQDGDHVDVEFVWAIRAEKPILRSLSWLLKPVFSWNHHWAMRQGEVSLERELALRNRHRVGAADDDLADRKRSVQP